MLQTNHMSSSSSVPSFSLSLSRGSSSPQCTTNPPAGTLRFPLPLLIALPFIPPSPLAEAEAGAAGGMRYRASKLPFASFCLLNILDPGGRRSSDASDEGGAARGEELIPASPDPEDEGSSSASMRIS